MNVSALLTNFVARSPVGAAILYFAAVALFVAMAWTTAADVLEQRAAIALTADILRQLDDRKHISPGIGGSEAPAVPGSPVLEGATVTIGGANLLRRVAEAVTQLDGNILYTQVDLQGPQSKEGFVSVTLNCELDQSMLQQLLYDLEAGMPFLFIDQLVVQAPAGHETVSAVKLNVLISVSGQWQGPK